MTTKEIVAQYGWQQGYNPRGQRHLLSVFTEELTLRLRKHMTPRDFSNAVREVRRKWDALSNRIPGGIPDGAWNFWYATTVVTMRDRCVTTANNNQTK